MSLRTDLGLNGLTPRKYTEVRTVVDGYVTYVCFFNRDDKTNTVTFVSGIRLVTYSDSNDKLARFIPRDGMNATIQALLDAQEPWDAV